MSDQTVLVPYREPRNLDQDAWYLYQTTSLAFYERCAKRCDEFADHFNRLITGQGARGRPKVDYWVSRYLNHAENIRRGITFIKQAGDYMPMLDFLRSPAADYRGLIENAFGYEARDDWRNVFQRLSYACGSGAGVLKNNEWKGLNWANRGGPGVDQRILDRDDSDTGDLGQAIEFAVQSEAIDPPPAPYPHHIIDESITGKPGARCPRSGVWVPQQWLDGAGDFSLAFCIEGRPMQPAYRIIGLEKSVVREAMPEHGLEEFATYSKVTRAEDTRWCFVHHTDAAPQSPDVCGSAALRLRCQAGQPCPREGWWSAPAKPDSRRRFAAGEVMPELGADFGTTIWQWDERQD